MNQQTSCDNKKSRQRDLDNILDAALIELDDSESDDEATESTSRNSSCSISKRSEISRPVFGPQIAPSSVSSSVEGLSVDEMLHQMEALLTENSETEPIHTKSTRISADRSKNEKCKKTGRNQTSTKQKSNTSSSDVDATVTKLLEELSRVPAADDGGGMMGQFEDMGENLIEEMAKEWQQAMKTSSDASGGKDGDDTEAVEQVVDGMMKQLLSKEFMYEPMKDICGKFPAWLAERKGKIGQEEYEKYGKQFQCFQKIVKVYEQDPDNFSLLSELMHDIQEYGQPPMDLIQELAPGLSLDEDGLPKGEDLRDAMNMPGGLPFAPGQEECCIM